MSSYYPHRPPHATSADELAQRMQTNGGAFRTPVPQQSPPAIGWDQQSQSQPQQSFGPAQAQPAVLSQTTGIHWPQFVNNHRLIGALVAGFAATQLATMFGFWAFGLGLPKLDFATFNGVILEPLGSIKPTSHQQWITGMLFHYANGMVFALGYALVIFPWLGKTRTTLSNLARSLGMGLFLATASCGWWVPALHPDYHPGFFSINLGVGTIIGIYVWHVVWSLALGFFFNPQD
ncbi:MAG: hypothetical protein J2O46_06390 [Nocardioides sp.]|nr:hypothetical protein [Nocardioides sp.]